MKSSDAFPYAGAIRIRFQGTLSARRQPAGTPNGKLGTILHGPGEGKLWRPALKLAAGWPKMLFIRTQPAGTPMTQPALRLLPSIAALCAALLPLPADADEWAVVMRDRDRRVEIDRATIIQSDGGTKVAWGRVVMSAAEAARVGYSTVKALNRYDCQNRGFITIKRVYLDADNLILREETVVDQSVVMVARNSVDERMWREVCRPPSAADLAGVAEQAGRAAAAATAAPRQAPAPRAAPPVPASPPARASAPAAAVPPPQLRPPPAVVAVAPPPPAAEPAAPAAAGTPGVVLAVVPEGAAVEPVASTAEVRPLLAVPPPAPQRVVSEGGEGVAPVLERVISAPDPAPAAAAPELAPALDLPPLDVSGAQPLPVVPPPAVAATPPAAELPRSAVVAQAAAAPRRAPPPAPARASAPPPEAPRPAPEWSYAGSTGPELWGRLSPEWAVCSEGRRQSPIDLADSIVVDLEPIRFDYRNTRFSVIDTGRQLRVRVGEGMGMEVRGQRYEVETLLFHRPAEVRVGGRAADMAVHFVHRGAQGQVAILVLALERAESANPVIQSVLNNLPLERGGAYTPAEAIDLAALLPSDPGHYLFMGSLSQPPCTEDVLWVVMRQPLQISAAQLDIFARLYPDNARPVQPANERVVLESR